MRPLFPCMKLLIATALASLSPLGHTPFGEVNDCWSHAMSTTIPWADHDIIAEAVTPAVRPASSSTSTARSPGISRCGGGSPASFLERGSTLQF